MDTPIDPQTDPIAPRKRPSRKWYLLSLAMLVGSASVFALAVRDKYITLKQQLEPMPRFVAPTPDEGFVVTVATPGKQNIYYENLGTLDGRTYDTPRRQVWTTYELPSMTCIVTRVDTGEAIEVRLPGLDEPETEEKSRISQDQIIAYDMAGMQGHSAWVFDADEPGDYRIDLRYREAVALQPGDIVIPPELTDEQKQAMLSTEGKAYEASRRRAVEEAALAELDPIDVLFAVGPDPTRGSFFNVIGLKGAATVLAFGFTFAALISLVTLMLRGGHLTPRGEMTRVQRMGPAKP
ncbi:MAG: hypothetical protein ACPGYV_14505 [Phycisphaeraceae bacterium]